jgi:CRISPR system Cascade subunit CasE
MAVIGCREFHPRPASGQRLAFLLTANPIKTIVDEQLETKPDKKSEKCRVPLLKEEEQQGWLSRKLTDAADVESSTVLPHPPLYFRKGNRGGKLLTVTFEGILKVRDGAALSKYLANSIGPAKGFGCGLMLVRRI